MCNESQAGVSHQQVNYLTYWQVEVLTSLIYSLLHIAAVTIQ